MLNPGKDELSAGEAAVLLGVSAKTVVRLAQAGRLPTAYITEGGHRRFHRADVESFAQERAA